MARLGKLLKVGVLAIFGALGTIAIAAIILYQSIDFKAAATDPVPKGSYHAWVCLKSGCNPFKVIDPADPRFDPKKFRFEDYEAYRQLKYVLSQIISRGMERSSVEQILVASGGATVFASTDRTIVQYTYPNKADVLKSGQFAIQVYYASGIYVEKVEVYGEEIKLKGGGS
jgi:hypothetical protein